jgi:beta-glucanase (GH16 family)
MGEFMTIRKYHAYLAVAACLGGFGTAAYAQTPYGQDPAGYTLTMNEEFNGTSLNSDRWSDRLWYESPNPTINYAVSNGSLKIWPQRNANGQFFNRYIATESAFNKAGFYQRYGYMEIEAKLPYGKGPIPTFWMYNHDHPDPNVRPEIDVMAAYPGGYSGGWANVNLRPTAYQVAAWGPNAYLHGSKMVQTSDLSAGFNKYAVKWTPDKITYYFNGTEVYSVWATIPRRLYLILGLGFGSASGTPDNTTPTGIGNSFEINYVRVWQHSGNVVQGFKTGMHAHRLYNNGGETGVPSTPPTYRYGIIRDWDIENLHDASIWRSDGSINFSLVDQVYSLHSTRNNTVPAGQGAKVLKTFGTVPSWASKRPWEPNRHYPSWPGALSGPANLDTYEDYVYRFVNHTKQYLWGVEGWNEPYACPGDPTEFTTMTPTELADVQKRLYLGTKRVDPRIPVLSPPQAYVCGIPTLLNAKTSQGEPMWHFFEVLSWHPYNRRATSTQYVSYAEEVQKVRNHLAAAGLSWMPIMDTEHGWIPAPKEDGTEFYAMSAAQKAQALYDTTQLAKSLGVLGIMWYGHDNDMIGKPMTNPTISNMLDQTFSHFNTP